MSSTSASLARPATVAQSHPQLVRSTRADLMLCLVVSSDPYRMRLFDRAAEDQGWDTILAAESEEAVQIATRERLQLAIVDLQSATPTTGAGYRRFVEWLSKKQQSLVVVCGNEDDSPGEIWSRQLGVWMYLPGVDDQSDIALVCGEARQVLEKMFGRPARSSGVNG
jgi:ActR/RegA family two-component response regulator